MYFFEYSVFIRTGGYIIILSSFQWLILRFSAEASPLIMFAWFVVKFSSV